MRWLVLLLVAAALLPAASASARPSGGTVTVKATIIPGHPIEMPGKIVMTPNHAKAGSTVTFVITNTDRRSDHAFEINGHQTKKFIPSGGQSVLRNVRFASPGRYVASCPDADRGIGGYFFVSR